jgi:hypothetical protein
VLDTEPGKPVAVLDHNPAHPGIGQDLPSLARSPLTPDPTSVTAASSVIPRSPASSATRPAWRSTSSRRSADETRAVSNSLPAGLGGGFHHDRAGRELASRHRQGSGMEPVQGGPVRNPLTPRPLGQPHRVFLSQNNILLHIWSDSSPPCASRLCARPRSWVDSHAATQVRNRLT